MDFCFFDSMLLLFCFFFTKAGYDWKKGFMFFQAHPQYYDLTCETCSTELFKTLVVE